DEIILVNRGRLFTENFTDPKPDTGESGSIKAVVTGLVQTSPQSAFSFAAKNDPDKNVWLTANADDIAAHEGLENVRPLLMQAEKSSVAKDQLEMRDATPPTLRNEHLQYAIFWYGMGIVLFIIALIRFRKKSA
ncbi:MAG: SURF1 family cytochrome oxidase biogenesis protein, partial [Pseudobdellovibrionaceae bacterium]